MRRTFTVSGTHCGSCGILIDDAVEGLPGVRTSTTDVRKARTVVEFDEAVATVQDITAAIEKEGYRVSQDTGG